LEQIGQDGLLGGRRWLERHCPMECAAFRRHSKKAKGSPAKTVIAPMYLSRAKNGSTVQIA
jgi:hypothetical protein